MLMNCVSCSDNHDFDIGTEFIVVTDVDVLDADKIEVRFNVSYTVTFLERSDDCPFETVDDHNSVYVEPIVRSKIRYAVAMLSSAEVEDVDENSIKSTINDQIEDGELSYNGKDVHICKSALRILTLTRVN